MLSITPVSPSRAVVLLVAAGAAFASPPMRLAPVRELSSSYTDEAAGRIALQGVPVSTAAADFDGDGVADLVVGYDAAGGALALHRGDVDAIFPYAPEAKLRSVARGFVDAPFLVKVATFDAPARPDLLGAGDVDGDGDADVVLASRGGRVLHILPGDGNGSLGPSRAVVLPGEVDEIVVGDLGRVDGLPDVVLGLRGSAGPGIAIVRAPGPNVMALPLPPRRAGAPGEPDVPAQVAALALGDLDGDFFVDVVAATGRELHLLAGRDFAFRSWSMPTAIDSLATGDFHPSPGAELAVAAGGRVHLLASGTLAPLASPVTPATGSYGSGSRLVRLKTSWLPQEDVCLVDPSRASLVMLSKPAGSAFGVVGEIDAGGHPVSILPMRLNGDGLGDLVVLRRGERDPLVTETVPRSTFTVDHTGNESDIDLGDGNCFDGVGCSLRAALEQANASSGSDTILFAIPGAGVQTITPPGLGGLPAVSFPTTIDGTSQPGYAGTPLIELNGQNVNSGIPGLDVVGTASVVRGLAINRFSFYQIRSRAASAIYEGNHLGVNPAGTALSPGSGLGFYMRFATGNLIGGTAAAARNLICGVGSDINGADGNTFRGNFFGTDVTGTTSLGYGFGIGFAGNVDGNTLGGAVPGARNLISGRTGGAATIVITGSANLVQGNLIGTQIDGVTPLPNTSNTIYIESSNNTIGGTVAAAGNVIAYNGGLGVHIPNVLVSGNLIRFNSFHGNGSLAIDEYPDGVSANDPGDADTGPNGRQNRPVVHAVTYDGVNTTIDATLDSTPGQVFTIDLYGNTSPDPSGFGEAQTYLATTSVTAISGDTPFSFVVPGNVPYPALTSTSPAGSTSELSSYFPNPAEASPAGDLRLRKTTGNSFEVTFTPACGATNHVLHYGTGPISGAVSWNAQICNLGTSGTASAATLPPAGNQFQYFVIVGHHAALEGSYGQSSAGVERPEYIFNCSCCYPQDLTGECP